MAKSFEDSEEELEKVGDGYKNLMASGIALLHPVKIAGSTTSEDGIPFHTTIKVFHPHEDRIDQAHDIATGLDLTPPDPTKTTVKPMMFKDRFGDDVHVLELGGDAEKIVNHNSSFSNMGFPVKFKFRPHITVDERTYNKAMEEAPKTAADMGIYFGNAELRHGYNTIKKYPAKE